MTSITTTPIWRLGLFTAAVAITATACLDSSRGGGSPPPPPAETVTQCTSVGRPDGYFKVNDNWDPTTCGNPATYTPNVSSYRRYDDKAVGFALVVCNDQSIPANWKQTATEWDPGSCGNPTTITPNMQTVERIS